MGRKRRLKKQRRRRRQAAEAYPLTWKQYKRRRKRAIKNLGRVLGWHTTGSLILTRGLGRSFLSYLGYRDWANNVSGIEFVSLDFLQYIEKDLDFEASPEVMKVLLDTDRAWDHPRKWYMLIVDMEYWRRARLKR